MSDRRHDTVSEARRGRGAVSNASGRFEAERREAADDGWGPPDDAPAPLRTTMTRDASRSIIARNNSPDLGFDRSINPYRGCEHGCVYCFARPTHSYLGLSAGLDFESRLFYKPDAAALLRQELADPKYRCRVIAMGTNTDPYQPVERQYRVTRQVLEVLAEHNHPVSIVTKSHLITRDIDILAPMAAERLAFAAVSVTTLDPGLARRLEPRAATPARRLDAIRALSAAGIPTTVMFAPAIPALNDPEMEAVLEAARNAGAVGAGYILLRLPHEIKDLFREWLAAHAPGRAERVLRLMREAHGGKDYDAAWGRRMTGDGPYARLIGTRFAAACRRLGLAGKTPKLDTGRFRPPPRPGDQLTLF